MNNYSALSENFLPEGENCRKTKKAPPFGGARCRFPTGARYLLTPVGTGRGETGGRAHGGGLWR